MSYGRGFVGENYKGEDGRPLNVVEIAKRIKAFVKWARTVGEAGGGIDIPAEAKVSATTERFSGGQAVNVTITGPAGWVYVSPGAPEGPEYYHQPAHGGYSLAAQVAQAIVESELQSYNHDDSDSQTDYFDVWFYGHVNLREQVEGGGYLRVDRSLPPVAIGSTTNRSEAREAVDLTPYMVAKAERAAYREEARREAAAAESAAQLDAAAAAFAAELESIEAPVEAIEAEATAAVVAASEAERAEEVAEIEAAANAFGETADAQEAIAREPDSYRTAGYDGRSIEATWVLTWHDEARTQPHEITQLMVHHHKGRGYTASLHRGTRGKPTEGNPYVGTMYADLMTAPRVGALIEGKRFARKALVEATKVKVAEVMAGADNPTYLAKFRVTAPAGTF